MSKRHCHNHKRNCHNYKRHSQLAITHALVPRSIQHHFGVSPAPAGALGAAHRFRCTFAIRTARSSLMDSLGACRFTDTGLTSYEVWRSRHWLLGRPMYPFIYLLKPTNFLVLCSDYCERHSNRGLKGFLLSAREVFCLISLNILL